MFVYVEQEGPKQDRARSLLRQAPPSLTILPVQVCGELYNVLTRKLGVDRSMAVAMVCEWREAFLVAATSEDTLRTALSLALDHRLAIWDATILAVSAEAGCELLLSEDMQDGLRWRGVTVVNPFGKAPSPLLDAFLAQS